MSASALRAKQPQEHGGTTLLREIETLPVDTA